MKNYFKIICLIIVSFFVQSILTACSDIHEDAQDLNTTDIQFVENSDKLTFWNDDTSYLDITLANQYLKENHLEYQDLIKFHKIGNIVFGDYLSKLMNNFENRSLDMLDQDLFVDNNSKKWFYSLLISDFCMDKRYSLKIFNESPNIHIMTNHIGERGNWIFVPIRVYFPAPLEYSNDPTYDENGGNDTRWRYYVLQLKKAESQYGWKIVYGEQVVNRAIDGEILEGAWFCWLNEHDSFSDNDWQEVDLPKNYWDFYIGNTKSLERSSMGIGVTKSMSSYYNRQSAASYAYLHADTNNYNTAYHSYAPNDCANFVSQCLYAGGIPMDNTWYASGSSVLYGSDTWVGANALYNYMKNNYGYYVTRTQLIDGYDNNNCDLDWGDILAMNKSNQATIADNVYKTHVMIISHSFHHTNQYYNGSPAYKVCGHTYDREDVDLMGLPGGRTYVTYHIMGVHITY